MTRGAGEVIGGEDDVLVAALVARQPSAFMRVYDRFAASTYSLALQIVGRAETAEAVIEDVFLALWRDPDAALSGPNGLRGYLADAVRRRALHHLEDA